MDVENWLVGKMKIELVDLFYGFIQNYWTFGLRFQSSKAKWTHKILGYFSTLGEMLGFVVENEWERYDLVWFTTYPDLLLGKPMLHIEHENDSSRLESLLEKVLESKAPSVIAVGYPEDTERHMSFVKKIRKLRGDIDKEVLFILHPSHYDTTIPITGYVFSPGEEDMEQLEAARHEAPDGTFYATYIDFQGK